MINIILVRAIQLVTALFFTTTVLIYAGALLLVPLAVLSALIGILSGIGFNGIFATLIGVPALIWLGARIHRIDGITTALADTGVTLLRMGVDVFRQFDEIARNSKQPTNNAASNQAL